MFSIRSLFARRLLSGLAQPKKTILKLETLDERTLPDATPVLTGIPGINTLRPLIGESSSFNFNFTNTGTDTGYSPFLDFAVDTTGADGAPNFDGILAPTLVVTGQQLTPVGTITVTGATYNNPFTGETNIAVPAGIGTGDIIYVFRLPFGSFTPGQTTMASASLTTSNLADAQTALPFSLRPVFRDGLLPTGGTPISGTVSGSDLRPEVFTLRKIYLGPEDETATGPNFKRIYRLEVDIATGQTLNSLQVRDLLANSMQWTGALNSDLIIYNAPGTPSIIADNFTGTTALTTGPGGEIVANFGSKTGIAGVDAALQFEFYIPRDRAGGAGEVVPNNLGAGAGTDSTFNNNTGSANAIWDAIDPRDGDTNPVSNTLPVNAHTLQQHSIATQKTVTAVDATGAPITGPIQPGITYLRYDIDFQVSDYYAFEDIFLNDILGDGQRLYLGGIAGVTTPTLTVNNPWTNGDTRGTTTTAAFTGTSTIDYSRQFTIRSTTESDPTATGYNGAFVPTDTVFNDLGAGTIDGGTFLRFNISDELIARGLSGKLVGGEIVAGGGQPTNNNPNAAAGAATGRITFYVEVKREFSDTFPSGDRSVDQGDILTNAVPLIQGTQLNTTNLTTVIGTGTDDSGSSVSIPRGIQQKELVAVNGRTTNLGTPLTTVQPGDRVTYRIRYELPISSFEQLKLTDFPPLPVFPVGSANQYTFNASTVPTYASYEIALGGIEVAGGAPGYLETFPTASVRVATTANITLSGTQTIDGVAVVAGNRVLVQNQTDATQNGVYVVAAGAWTRATDFNDVPELANGTLIQATEGTLNGGKYFVQTNTEFITIGGAGATSNLVYTPFITTDTVANTINFNFGNRDDLLRRTTTIDLLITLPVFDAPFVSDLNLTNQFLVTEGSTNNGLQTTEAIRQFQIVRPVVTVNKGVVGSRTTGSTLGGITFNDPTAASNFTGIIDTIAEAAAIGANNASNLDAGDQVRYAVVLQNTGRGDAFDLVFDDVLPVEYTVPTSANTFITSSDFVVRRGDGTQLTDGRVVSMFVTLATTADVGGTFNVDGFGVVTLSGSAGIVDGIVLNVGDTVLVKNQATAAQNGVYTVTAVNTNGTVDMTRGNNFNGNPPADGFAVAVLGGTVNADRRFTANPALDTFTADSAPTETTYYFAYNPTTRRYQLNLPDVFTSGNTTAGTEDDRTGAISRGDSGNSGSGFTQVSNGSNTIVVTYDLVIRQATPPGQAIINTATVRNLGTTQGGINQTPPGSQPSDNATVNIPTVGVVKIIDSTEITSAGNNAADQATIGEIVTYRLTVTVPEGTSYDARIVDTLDPGLAFVDVTSVTSSAGLAFDTGLPSVSATPANTTITNSGGTITFNLGTVTNSNTDNAVAETIEIIYRVVVLNTNTGGANNQAGTLRNNSAAFQWAASSGGTVNRSTTASAPNVTIVEPNIAIAKQVRNVSQAGTFAATSSADFNDTMEYRVVLTSSGSTAYDVSLSDQIPTLITAPTVSGVSQTGTIYRDGVSHTLTAADFTIVGNLLTLNSAFNYDIDPSSTVTITLQGTYNGSTGANIGNTAEVRWTSLDGTPAAKSTYDTSSVERTGADGPLNGGTLNDYRTSSTATIDSPPLISKVIVSTSETSTTGSNVTIGEIVRYRIVTTVGEGTLPAFTLQDFLPTGMSFLNDGSARYAFISTGSTDIASTTAGGVPSLSNAFTVLGSNNVLATLNSSQVSGTFADGNISDALTGAGTGEATIYADGASVYFRFGDIANTDNDADNEYIVVEFNALVLNTLGNQNAVTRSNTTTLLIDTDSDGTPGYISIVRDTNFDGVRDTGDVQVAATDPSNDGSGTPALSAPAAVTIVEPTLTIDKTVIAATANTVTFQIVVANTGTATAFNTQIEDLIPVEFDLTLASISTSTTGAGTSVGTADHSDPANRLRFLDATITVGGSITITFTTVVAVPLPALTTNTTATSYTSLPGTGTTGNPTGSNTPGASGASTGERDGTGGVNDYTTNDSIPLGSLGDTVWVDFNANGVIDASEPGIPNVVIELYTPGVNGIAGDGDDVLFATATTDANGVYHFNAIPLTMGATANYSVRVLGSSVPAGLTQNTFDLDNGTTSPNAATNILLSTTNSVRNDADFGYRGPGQIGDTIFLDQNANGVYDLGEELTGIVVTLTGDGNGDGTNETYTRTTNASGQYLFDGLPAAPAGTPYIVNVLPASLPQDGAGNPITNTVDPDAGTANQSNVSLTTAAPINLAQDFGYRGPGRIGDTIFLDVNGNNLPDVGEGLANVIVTLSADVDGDSIPESFTRTTDANGIYNFDNLPVRNPAGTLISYTVTVNTSTIPNGVPNTVDPDGGTLNQSTLTLDPTTPVNLAQDFGYRGPGRIGDTVFLDYNANGIPDVGEGIGGVVLTLTADVDGDGVPDVFTVTTDANGVYSFDNLPILNPAGNAISYTVAIDTTTLPQGVTNTVDPDGGVASQSTLTLSAGAPVNLAQDFGYRGPGRIGDTIFLDVNGNGTPEANELLANVVVTLSFNPDLNGPATTLTATTDANGLYIFENLPTTDRNAAAIQYTVGVVTATLPSVVTNTVDPDGGTPSQSVLTLTNAAPENLAQDFGYRGPGQIGDTIFLDLNGNGLPDAEEALANVIVRLSADIDGDGTPEQFTTTTNASGQYLFSNLPTNDPSTSPITYTITVDPTTLPQDVLNTTDPDGGTANQSQVVLSAAAPVNLAQDFGYRGPGQIGDTIFLDFDNNGLPIPGEGIAGAIVVMQADVDNDGTPNAFTRTTNATGNYVFNNLPTLDRLGANITYTVTVQANTLPPAVVNVIDPNGGNDNTSTVALSPSSPVNLAQDFGYRSVSGSIGDRVWLDQNGNGVQDLGEPGLYGVDVRITNPGADGLFNTADDLFTTVQTGLDGSYLFTGLPAGTFRIDILTPTLPSNVAPTFDLDSIATPHSTFASLTAGQVRRDVDFGYRGTASVGDTVWLDRNADGVRNADESPIPGTVITLQSAGRNDVFGDADDLFFTATTDANGNYIFEGLPVFGGTPDLYRATVANPLPGTELTYDLDGVGTPNVALFTLADAQNRRDVDFGYRGTGSLAGIVFSDPNDNGLFDAGDAPIPGATLTLVGRDVLGNRVSLTTQTDANGAYSFGNLVQGNYEIVETQPAGFLDGFDAVGSLGAAVAVSDYFGGITILAGQIGTGYNFGEVAPSAISGTVYFDRNNNGNQDGTEPGIPNVLVQLTGTDNRGTPVSLQLTTDANGNYIFPNLRPGTYTLLETQPRGFAQGRNRAGSVGGEVARVDTLRQIVLGAGQVANGYLFGEVTQVAAPMNPVGPMEMPVTDPSKRDFLASTLSIGEGRMTPDYSALGSVSADRATKFVVTSDGSGGQLVRVFDVTAGAERFQFNPFPGFTGGVRTATADVTGDGISDIIVAAGTGGGPNVKVYDGNTGALVRDFFAFELNFTGGLHVASGDFDNDGRADIVISADAGGGPRIIVFSGLDNRKLIDFFAFNEVTFRGGSRVAVGDINGDGIDDLVVGAGMGGGPRVSILDGTGIGRGQLVSIGGDFFAFELDFTGGITLAVGDVNNDGFGDVIVGAGAGGGPRVLTFSGRDRMAGRSTWISDFFVGDANERGGVRVSALDLNGDDTEEIVAGLVVNGRNVVRFFDVRSGAMLDQFFANFLQPHGGANVSS